MKSLVRKLPVFYVNENHVIIYNIAIHIAIHKRYVLLLSKLIRWRMGSGSSSKEKPKPEVKAQPSQPPSNSLSGKVSL